jgi:predicted RNA binding protein YcfA (HicA-like mRNA interferase family)
VILRRPGGGPTVPVPAHAGRDLPAGTLHSILRLAQVTADELRGAL